MGEGGMGGDAGDEELGVYFSPEYGFAVTFNEEAQQAVGYAVANDRCWAQPIPQEVWWLEPHDDQGMHFTYFGQKQPGMYFKKMEGLEEVCSRGTILTSLDSDFVPDWELEFELFDAVFDTHYAFFDERGVDWKKETDDASELISPEMSVAEFFAALTQTVEPLKDGHVAIEAGEGLSFLQLDEPDIQATLTTEALAHPDAPAAESDEWEDFLQEYRETELGKMHAAIDDYIVPNTLNGSFEDAIVWAVLQKEDKNYGYFRITRFAELPEGEDAPVVSENRAVLDDAIDAALEDFEGVEGVVLDVRINSGGWDVLGRTLTSHFVEETTHLYSKRVYLDGELGEKMKIEVEPAEGRRFSGPVAVLTGPTTISAAETFVLGMVQLDNVVLVGQPSQGMMSDSLPKFLPSGIFFSLSNEIYESPAGDIYESVGVPPHIETDVFSKQDREQGRDSAIAAALAKIDED